MGKRKGIYLAKLRLMEEFDVTTLQNNLKQALDDVKNLEEQLTAAQAEVKALEKKVVKSKAVKSKAVKSKTTKSGTKK